MKRELSFIIAVFLGFLAPAWAGMADKTFDQGPLKSIDSGPFVQVGAQAPDFTLPSIDGTMVTLSSFQGRKNVMLTFVPAAWTPVCSDQWPGYNLVRDMFEERDAVVIGISVDNLPTLHSWVREMGGLWFSVLSDFWPHGRVASLYGVLRGDGTAERAVFVIDRRGVVRYVNVNDVNTRPSLQPIMQALDDLAGQ